MLDHLGEVEIEHRIVFAEKHVEANGVTADFVHDFAQGNELAGPLRHFHGFACAQQSHKLHQFYVQLGSAGTHGFDSRLHPFDVAAVVGPPDINQVQESADHLRSVI